MKNIEIHITKNNDHKFIVNGETIYEGDTIVNFVHKPFEEWKDVILEELYENCNEEYCIYLFSGEEEYKYLDEKRKTFSICKDIIWHKCNDIEDIKKKRYDENIWEQLDEIYRKEGDSLTNVVKIEIGLFVSEEKMSAYQQIIDSIINEGFSRGSFSFKCPYFNFVIQEIEDYDIPDFKGICFHIGDNVKEANNVFPLMDCKTVGKFIKDFIKIAYVEKFIGEYKLYASVGMNEQTGEGCMCVEIPKIIEIGTSQPINIQGLSREEALSTFIFESSNPDILKCDNGYLYALSRGTVEVRIKVKGKIEPIERDIVEVVEHIRVQSINLKYKYFKGVVGDSFIITPEFFPQDAENIKDVQYESLNTNIATVGSDGSVKLLSKGNTKIKVSVGKIETFMNVEVNLKITQISVEQPSVKLIEGESIRLQIYIEPSCYDISALDIKNYNADIATLNNGTIKARTPGETFIELKSPNSDCSATVKVKVLSSKYVLARRAFDLQNYSEASMYYNQLKEENPNDWEAVFFSVCAKAHRVSTPETTNILQIVLSTFSDVFDIILDLETEAEAVGAFTKILCSVASLVNKLVEQAKIEYYNKIEKNYTDRNLYIETSWICWAVTDTLSSCIEEYIKSILYSKRYPQLIDEMIKLIKVGIEILVELYSFVSIGKRKAVQNDINISTAKVRKYEPNYNAPRPNTFGHKLLKFLDV